MPAAETLGLGKHASADGTRWNLYEQNLLSEYHVRYGGYGGIGYYHVSDTYIALFSHFIPCGVWEAVYILDGLQKNESNIQPDTLHGDTQAQSTPVFGLSHLLGIDLMPRIRNWKSLDFYRPDPSSKYPHIDALFFSGRGLGSDRDPLARHAPSRALDSGRKNLGLRDLAKAWICQPQEPALLRLPRTRQRGANGVPAEVSE